MLISVVIPTYERPDMLRRALSSVMRQHIDNSFCAEIVVVDNGPTEAARKVVEELATDSPIPIRYVREEVKGYQNALNAGVRNGHGDWFAFFDDDQLAEPDWLKELLAAAIDTGAPCAGGGIRLQLPDEVNPLPGAVCRALLGEHDYSGPPQLCTGKEIPSGGNMLVSRHVFVSIGVFDTSLTIMGNDTDFLRRARQFGFAICLAPRAIVHHCVPAYRLAPRYLRWVSFRWGSSFAYLDFKHSGRGKTFLFAVARTGQALLANLPRMLLSLIMRNGPECLDRTCLLWRAAGYSYQALRITTPGLHGRRRFLSYLESWKEPSKLSSATRPPR